jgi:hypothetical protein
MTRCARSRMPYRLWGDAEVAVCGERGRSADDAACSAADVDIACLFVEPRINAVPCRRHRDGAPSLSRGFVPTLADDVSKLRRKAHRPFASSDTDTNQVAEHSDEHISEGRKHAE